jgi:hypothetical protein
MEIAIDVPWSVGESVRNAWFPRDPAKVQLVACVDLVSSGAEVKKCGYEDCPTMVFVNDDKKINTAPGDRQIYELLRGYVTRK